MIYSSLGWVRLWSAGLSILLLMVVVGVELRAVLTSMRFLIEFGCSGSWGCCYGAAGGAMSRSDESIAEALDAHDNAVAKASLQHRAAQYALFLNREEHARLCRVCHNKELVLACASAARRVFIRHHCGHMMIADDVDENTQLNLDLELLIDLAAGSCDLELGEAAHRVGRFRNFLLGTVECVQVPTETETTQVEPVSGGTTESSDPGQASAPDGQMLISLDFESED